VKPELRRAHGWDALVVDGVVQSIAPLSGLTDGGYWRQMVPDEKPDRVLILGYGGGTLSGMLHQKFGRQLPVLGIDWSPETVALGWRVTGDEVVFADAIDWVANCTERYDYVAVDLYEGGAIEPRVCSRSFARDVVRLCSGLLVVNLFAWHSAAEFEEQLTLVQKKYVGNNQLVFLER